MTILFFRHTNTSGEVCDPVNPYRTPPRMPFHWLLIIVMISAYFMSDTFITYDKYGMPHLAPWRQEKLDKELNDLDHAEQYVLQVLENAYYPCYSCPDVDSIYLTINQVWKYGITTKGAYGRYRNSLTKKRLRYIVQFEGTLTECLKEEKRKIYRYALLQENLVRAKPLIRPPGNKRDN